MQGSVVECWCGFRLNSAPDFSAPVALVGENRKTLQIILNLLKIIF
jgi:hypothetical protein